MNSAKRAILRLKDWRRGRRVPQVTDDFTRLVSSGVLAMGRYSYGRPHVRRFAGDSAAVRIGSFVSIADDVEFIPGGKHRLDWVSMYPFRFAFKLPGSLEDGHPAAPKGDIVVGSDVWIATGARILSGVSIGNGAAVGAGAVVSRDVRPYAVVVGNPAKEIYRRFTDEQIDALEQIAWWEWPIERILDHLDILCSDDVDALIRRALLRDSPP